LVMDKAVLMAHVNRLPDGHIRALNVDE
jgi:hypothetical protein